MSEHLEEWFPVRIIEENEELLVQWMRFGEPDFKEPFFDEAIAKARIAYPENRKRFRSVTCIDVLKEHHSQWNDHVSFLIFHVSRCGSTLLAQLLNQIPNTLVLAEVPLLDEIIAFGVEGRIEDSVNVFRSAVRILGMNSDRIILKTDSWHLLHFDFYRACYADAPTVLLHRKPSDIIASHKRLPGMQTAQNLLRPAQLNSLMIKREEHELPALYFYRLLTQFYISICEIIERDVRSFVGAYDLGVDAIFVEVLSALHVDIDPITRRGVEERGRFNSKMPDVIFAQEKQTEPVECVELNAAYAKLQDLRIAISRSIGNKKSGD